MTAVTSSPRARQHPVQRFSLSIGARKPVVERPLDRRALRALPGQLVESLLDERDCQIVRDQFSSVVDRLDSLTEIRATFDCRAKELAGGDRARFSRARDSLALRSFPRPLRTHQDDVQSTTETLLG